MSGRHLGLLGLQDVTTRSGSWCSLLGKVRNVRVPLAFHCENPRSAVRLYLAKGGSLRQGRNLAAVHKISCRVVGIQSGSAAVGFCVITLRATREPAGRRTLHRYYH